MTTALPSEIKVQSLRQGARYDLPPMPVRRLRYLVLIPVVFGLIFTGFAAIWISLALQSFLKIDPRNGWLLLFPAFGLPFVLAGLVIIRAGMLLILARRTLELEAGQMKFIERSGPFWRTRQIPLAKVRRFTVKITRFNLPPQFGGTGDSTGALELELADGKPLEILRGYPVTWLQPLAGQIAAQTGVQLATVTSAPVPTVALVREPVNPPDPVDTIEREQQPAGSRIKLVSQGHGVTITVPPAGLWRGSRGLFLFALVWMGFTSAIFGTVLLNGKGPRGVGALGLGAFILLFEGVGVAMLLGAINMGRRRALILADSATLKIGHRSLFGTKSWVWPSAELACIHVGPSGMKVNHQPVLQLQIQARDAQKVGLFAGRKVEELRWLATQLRRATGVTVAPLPPPPQ